jgi:hypothetical protein
LPSTYAAPDDNVPRACRKYRQARYPTGDGLPGGCPLANDAEEKDIASGGKLDVMLFEIRTPSCAPAPVIARVNPAADPMVRRGRLARLDPAENV